jgi:site-specific recombinase XerD
MRHTFASIAAQQGVSIYTIASWMGHSAIEVTELHAHLSGFEDDIERLNTTAQTPTHRPVLRIVK